MAILSARSPPPAPAIWTRAWSRIIWSPWLDAASRPAVHRERRQSGLPHQLRPRRRRQSRGAQRHRRRRQAAEISRNFSQSGVDDPEQDRSASLRSFRSRAGAAKTRARSIRTSKLSKHPAPPKPDCDHWLDWRAVARVAQPAALKSKKAEEVAHAVTRN